MKNDLTGQKFNNLSVIECAGRDARNTIWLCRCDCGAECTATTHDLTSGHKKSCGCRKRVTHAKDLMGQTFGRLTVIKRKGTKGSRALWRCRCKCGKYCDVRSIDLISGNTKSCGCWGKHRAIYDRMEVQR